ncbi:MAG: DUF92 domain-containing protein [Gemmatimonadota bacterium]|nr:DUF92 domain-containing protein [Gemmatimonadota bacterium]
MPQPDAYPAPLIRALLGFLVASAIALGARRAGALSTSGALAAAGIGTVCVAAGTGWGVLLIAYFVGASLLTRHGRQEKERRTEGVVAKAGARDATQVIANGGIYAACLVVAAFSPERIAALVYFAAVGALAASSADTWATEIGTLHGGTPRSLFTFKRVATGTSGGISLAGSVAMVGGAGLVALIAMLVGLPSGPWAVIIGGSAGAIADSVLGATLQERRWCPNCATASEQLVHSCGIPTALVGGVSWINNDTVNLLSTVVGGVVAACVASL